MKTNSKAVEYNLQICIGSSVNDRVENIESSTPFQAFSIGDRFIASGFNTEAWHDLPKQGESFYIIGKEHIVADIGASILHTVTLCIKAMPTRDIG